MADWNPAEMIGDKPAPLSISLYRELITDNIWSQQRNKYGYKDCASNVLMFDFLGSPYIDIRTDLNSFLPKIFLRFINIAFFFSFGTKKPFLSNLVSRKSKKVLNFLLLVISFNFFVRVK